MSGRRPFEGRIWGTTDTRKLTNGLPYADPEKSGAAAGGDQRRPRAGRDSWVSNTTDVIQRPACPRGFC
jgi:hypothetical protein